MNRSSIRINSRLGKYKIERRLGEGGFANVYRALDTIEGIRVALKVPHTSFLGDELLDCFRHEVRLTARLDHPNILPLKNAAFVDGRFVIAVPLGERSLADRLRNRIASRTALHYSQQGLEGLAHAHRHKIIHCDIKPENFILFPGDQLRLADFGISKVALNTVHATGSGTLGYMAPEQAMGRPSFRSDVFSMGLIMYRMFSGWLPEWPYEWPFSAHERLQRNQHPDLIALLKRSLEVDARRRFENADHMLRAFLALKRKALSHGARKKPRRPARATLDWREVRRRDFRRQFGRGLEALHNCPACQGPVSEAMLHCPWCRHGLRQFRGVTRFPASCPRCMRGMKKEWVYCPWCYGASVGPRSNRRYDDKRYSARCSNSACREPLMPFMRYCPWCRSKVRRTWPVPDGKEKCPSCHCGVHKAFWSYCPWCRRSLEEKR